MLFVHAQIARHKCIKRKYGEKMDIDEMVVLALMFLRRKCIKILYDEVLPKKNSYFRDLAR